MSLPWPDIAVVLLYVVAIVAFGCFFLRSSGTTEGFTAAGRRLPGWAVGLSIFGTFLSSNTFLGVPGKVYGSNWNAYVFSLSLPLAAWIATRWFVPFYRAGGEISAYHHLESRFGPWARTYAVLCYLLTQLSRTGSIMFGVSLAVSALLGWDVRAIIIGSGILVTLYTLLGGIEAVIWTDVVQSIILIAGALLIAGLLLFEVPGGPAQSFALAAGAGKFSLGSFGLDLTQSTFWVVLVYGLFINLTNFGIDQSYVQRYLTAKTDREANKSVWLGAILYVPASLLFFLIGASLFSYYEVYADQQHEVRLEVARATGQELPEPELYLAAEALTDAQLGDKVLPHFIATRLRGGLAGLLIAAILAASMSSIDTSLNSSATILLKDIWLRYVRRDLDDAASLRFLRWATLACGAAGTAVALKMIGVHSVLDAWWKLQGVFSGGMLGLFLLGMIARRAGHAAGVAGLLAGLLVIGWMTLTPQAAWCPSWLQCALHTNLTIVVGTLTIFGVGSVVARAPSRRPSAGSDRSG